MDDRATRTSTSTMDARPEVRVRKVVACVACGRDVLADEAYTRMTATRKGGVTVDSVCPRCVHDDVHGS